MQTFQQALAVQAQVQFLSVDHDAIEEGIHRGAQGGQHLQRSGVVTGFELGMGMALLLIVAAEMNGALAGIGYLVWASYAIYNLKAMFVAFICIAALGYAFAEGLNALQRKIIPWRQM